MVGTHQFDTVLDLCTDQHRRIVLAILTEERRSLTVDDLTETIVKYNHQASMSDVSEDVLDQVRLSLHHVHLPKLAQAGVVEYDPERHRVEPTEQFDLLQPSLSAILDADPTLDVPIEL